MNIYHLEKLIEEHRTMKEELERRQKFEHQKIVLEREILDDENLVYCLTRCIQTLERNNILTQKQAVIYMDVLRKKFATRGIYFARP